MSDFIRVLKDKSERPTYYWIYQEPTYIDPRLRKPEQDDSGVRVTGLSGFAGWARGALLFPDPDEQDDLSNPSLIEPVILKDWEDPVLLALNDFDFTVPRYSGLDGSEFRLILVFGNAILKLHVPTLHRSAQGMLSAVSEVQRKIIALYPEHEKKRWQKYIKANV